MTSDVYNGLNGLMDIIAGNGPVESKTAAVAAAIAAELTICMAKERVEIVAALLKRADEYESTAKQGDPDAAPLRRGFARAYRQAADLVSWRNAKPGTP